VPEREPGAEHEALERRIGHRFRTRALLEQALTHRSSAHERGDLALANERLEFLGDAVLGLLVAEALMERRPLLQEGDLSRARAALVNERALAAHASALGIDALLRLGRGESRSGGRRKQSILANALEALIGAIYLDGGLDRARAFVRRELGEALEGAGPRPADAKTQLQELVQRRGEALPAYDVLATSGPDHDPCFEVGVRVGDRLLARARGRSKRSAEQAAAQVALERLAVAHDPGKAAVD
jgi:ribonuclease-3